MVPIIALFALLTISSCADKMDYFPDMNGATRVISLPAPPSIAPPAREKVGDKAVPRVLVKPVSGVSLPMSRLLARSVVDNLREMNVFAVAKGGNDNNYVLSGKAEANWRDERAPFTAIIRWTLVDRAGKPVAVFTHGVRATWWQWRNGAPQVIRRIGISAAKPVADLLAVKKERQAPPELMDTMLMVRSVKGAPGGGNQTLRRAIIKALKTTDVSITEDPRQAAFILDGKVSVSSEVNNSGRNMERVVIEWTVRTANNREIGKSSRQVTISRGMFDHAWGQLAIRSGAKAVGDIERIITGTALPTRSRQAPHLPKFKPSPPLRHVPGRALPPPP